MQIQHPHLHNALRNKDGLSTGPIRVTQGLNAEVDPAQEKDRDTESDGAVDNTMQCAKTMATAPKPIATPFEMPVTTLVPKVVPTPTTHIIPSATKPNSTGVESTHGRPAIESASAALRPQSSGTENKAVVKLRDLSPPSTISGEGSEHPVKCPIEHAIEHSVKKAVSKNGKGQIVDDNTVNHKVSDSDDQAQSDNGEFSTCTLFELP